MKITACFCLALLMTVPAWPQASDQAEAAQDQNSKMAIPPPVNIETFPVAVGSEMLTNYFRGDLAITGGYTDNLFTGIGTGGKSETMATVLPTLIYDQTTSTQHRTIFYSSGFSFYQPTSSLNQVDQNAVAGYQLRLSEHATVNLNDAFEDTSNGIGQGYPTTVSGSFTPGVVPTFAPALSNHAKGEFSLQTGVNSMVGGAGMVGMLHYPSPKQAPGLYESGSRGGSAFYTRRISDAQYVGATWEYADFLTYPIHATSQVQTHTLAAFYSLVPNRQFSLSISAGPQHYDAAQGMLPQFSSWAPYVNGSVGWEASHATFTLTYEHATTGGGGLLGAFKTESGSGAARWQFSRTWITGVAAAYANYHTVTPPLSVGSNGGHSLSGSAILEHDISQHLRAEIEYDRLHQMFGGIPAIEAAPDSNRETVSLVLHFTRPFGY